MAATSERRSRIVEALGFWFVTLLICAVAGFGSYRFGREWIGDRLDGDVKTVLTSDDLTERINPDTFAGGVNDDDDEDEVADEPPEEAVVEVEPTEVSAADEEAFRSERQREVPKRDEPDERDDDADDPDEDADDADEDVAMPEVPEESGGEYVVRAGSFGDAKNADAMVEKLRNEGYHPYITTVTVDGKEYTRVNVASYKDQDEALKLRGALRDDDYEAEIGTE